MPGGIAHIDGCQNFHDKSLLWKAYNPSFYFRSCSSCILGKKQNKTQPKNKPTTQNLFKKMHFHHRFVKISFVGLNQRFFKPDNESCHFIFQCLIANVWQLSLTCFVWSNGKNYFAYQTDTDAGRCKSVGSQWHLAHSSYKEAQNQVNYGRGWAVSRTGVIPIAKLWGECSSSQELAERWDRPWGFFTFINREHECCYYVQSAREIQYKSAAGDFNEGIHS